jgi:multiple sugar transport system permease protein
MMTVFSKKKIRGPRVAAYVFLFFMMLAWIIPLSYAVFTSFKSESEIRQVGFRLVPKQWSLVNYQKALSNTTNAPLLRWFLNSVVIASSHTFLVILVVSMAGYGYTRVDFWGRDNLFIAIFCISLFPGIVGLIPTYNIVNIFGWVDTILACIIPGLGGVGNVFLVRQFMMGIPKEYDESARIDGAGNWSIYYNVILPLMSPILTVIALFSFTGSWNDFLWPSIVFNGVENMTSTVGLELMKNLYGDFMYIGQLMAGTIVAIIPPFLIFMFAQKYFLQSMSLTSGVKG